MQTQAVERPAPIVNMQTRQVLLAAGRDLSLAVERAVNRSLLSREDQLGKCLQVYDVLTDAMKVLATIG